MSQIHIHTKALKSHKKCCSNTQLWVEVSIEYVCLGYNSRCQGAGVVSGLKCLTNRFLTIRSTVLGIILDTFPCAFLSLATHCSYPYSRCFSGSLVCISWEIANHGGAYAGLSRTKARAVECTCLRLTRSVRAIAAYLTTI
ncbi:hypothetical protein L218DRAFT_699716 [Marasmius fiardii PR-910]|nr:hypothetical protein L218DRAFT_699716 [Marasmius fiardii PR-910]